MTTTYGRLLDYRREAYRCHMYPATDKQLGLITHLLGKTGEDMECLPFAEANHGGQIILCLSKRAAERIIDHLRAIERCPRCRRS